MNSELTTTENVTSAAGAASPNQRLRRMLAVAAVAVVGLSACNSDPGRKRVVEDIIETSVNQGDLTEAEGKCMFDKIELYSEDELEAIADSANDAGPGTAIELYEADLASCKE